MVSDVGLTINHDIVKKRYENQGRDVKLVSVTTDHHSMRHSVATPSDHTYWKCMVENVVSGCDQCMWPVGVVTGWGIE